MSVEGRIIVDALFHDKDGTNAINVVSLSQAKSYASGKVAIITGTVGTAAITIDPASTTYRDAAGTLVSMTNAERLVFSCSSRCSINEAAGSMFAFASENSPVVAETEQGGVDGIVIGPIGNTANYTLVIYGS